MAYETGTATDHVDLYTKLYNFLTANTDLVTASQEWANVWGATPPFTAGETSDVMLKGPGLAGLDEVFISFRLVADDTNDRYGIVIRGHDGVLAGAANYADHINTSPFMHVALLNGAMDYWLVANGRRFVLVVKTSTNYGVLYGGLIRPFATPAGYPYPIAIGGSMNTTGLRWSDESHRHTHFVNPGPRASGDSGFNSSVSTGSTLRIRLPSGEWRGFRNNSDGSFNGDWGYTFPWRPEALAPNEAFMANDRQLLGGGYLLTPVCALVNDTTSVGQVKGSLGAFDGIFHVAGFGNSAENTVTIDTKTYLVVQNAFRTNFDDYWALLLE